MPKYRVVLLFFIVLLLIPLGMFLGKEALQKFLFKSQTQKLPINAVQTDFNNLACPIPKQYCHNYKTEKAEKIIGDFLVFPPNIPADTSLYAVWDGEIQPGRAGKDNQTASSIVITKNDGTQAVYLFNGNMANEQNLPYKVKKGEKIAQLKGVIPPAFSKEQTMLVLNFQKNNPSATGPGRLTILETKGLTFE